MFRTQAENIVGFTGMFEEGLTSWHEVSRAISSHWYQVLVRKEDEGCWRQEMHLLNDERTLGHKLSAQSSKMYVVDVQVSTPPYMNGSSRWRAEPVQEVTVGQDATGCYVTVIKIEDGATYHTCHTERFDPTTLSNLASVYRSCDLQVAAE